jgi:hypothetical protein
VKVKYSQKRAGASQSEISKVAAVEMKAQDIDRRRLYNRTLKEFTQALPHP